MKKKQIFAGFMVKSAVATIALLFVATVSFGAPIYVKGEKARLRSGPGANYKILWTAERYTPLEFLAKYKEWYAVRDFEGDVAWVHEVTIGKGRALIVTNKKANVRKGPGTSFDIVFSVERGYPFKVIDSKGSWYKVTDAQGDTGWIINQLVWVSR